MTFKTIEGAKRAMEDSNKTIEVSVISLVLVFPASLKEF